MDTEWHSQLPPPLEEGYWEALLREGEHAEPVTGEANGYSRFVFNTAHRERPFGTFAIHDIQVDSAEVDRDWHDIEAIMNDDETIELPVTGYNRGGLLVEWRNLRGFVPASQLVGFPTHMGPNTRRDLLMERVGYELSLRVIELDRDQNRLVLSERAAQVQPGERAHILEHLARGDIVKGAVTNICDFGAFVDLGGLEGLIHISELSWGRVGHPTDVLERGEIVRVHVLDTDKDAGRVALSLKRLYPDPWRTVEQKYTVGEVIEVIITNVVDFGAFACIEEGLEGLIHISELSDEPFLHPCNVLDDGQIVHARILSIDSQSRRLGLSLRHTHHIDSDV
jgi:small subunit ribosomal protein S1